MDSASELVHSLLPVFLVTILGASTLTVGLIEGLSEATVAFTRLFSGAFSDYLGKRKILAVAGYALAALSKPLFPLAASVIWVFAARFVDRLGKGIRGAPRDALIGDIAPPRLRGACFGLRQSLDTVGALLGPLLAMLFMVLLANDIRAVFWIAVVPALAAVVLLVAMVKEPACVPTSGGSTTGRHWRGADLRRAGTAYWLLLGIAVVLHLARFSEAFLILRAAAFGHSLALLPLVLAAMNLAYAVTAYPVGWLSDRIGRHSLLLVGSAVLIAADAALALANGLGPVLLGAVLWGLHMGLTQGLLAALVTDSTAPAIRGTAFGVFHMATGLALLSASLLAGWLWDSQGPDIVFWVGMGFASLAFIGLVIAPHGKGAG